MKALWVSRHKPQPMQEKILKSLGIEEIIQFSDQVKDVKELIDFAKKHDCKVIIPVLPLSLLVQLLPLASREGIDIWQWEMERRFISSEEAEKLSKEGITVDIDITSQKAVAFIPKRLKRLVKIEIVSETLWESQ